MPPDCLVDAEAKEALVLTKQLRQATARILRRPSHFAPHQQKVGPDLVRPVKQRVRDRKATVRVSQILQFCRLQGQIFHKLM